MRWTVDEQEDLNVVKNIYNFSEIDFSWEDV